MSSREHDDQRHEPVDEYPENEGHESNPQSQERASDLATETSEQKRQKEEEAGGDMDKNRYDKKGPHPITGLIIYTVLQFVALLFVVVATPIEMFTIGDEWRDRIYPELAGTDKTLCVTAWGMKAGCRSTRYHNRDYTRTFCSRMRLNFKIVQAFCIIAIGFMSFGLLLGVASIMHKVGKGSVGAIATFAMLCCLMPWGIMGGMYWQLPCCETDDWYLPTQRTTCYFDVQAPAAATGLDVPAFGKMGKYAAGFGLIVTAWCLQVIAVVFAFLPF